MAQHDYVIANGSGSAVRGDLNNALAAIVSNNSGTSEPSPTYAYQFWADTTTGLLKIRNAANNAWITLRELDGTLLIEAGTVLAPGLYFVGDTNTGIYSPAADQFAITTNGVERVEWGTGEVVFNDGGVDYDFRIEGDTKANLFFIDASTDSVSIDGTTLQLANRTPLRLGDSDNSHCVALRAPATVPTNVTWDLPAADGASGQAVVTNGSGGLSFASLTGTRNRIINGAMLVSQRVGDASQTITAGAALAYTVDRFYGYSTGANVTGQRVQGALDGQFRYQFTGAGSVTAIGFGQRIERLNSADLADTTATLSVDLANSLLTTVTWTAFYANTADTFGTLASPTRTQIATGTFTVTSTVTRYSTQISIPSAATTGIEIVLTVGAQTSGTWTIGNVQLEQGSVATPFERRPVVTEQALCQRYYYQTSQGNDFYGRGGSSSNTTYHPIIHEFPVIMRAAPSFSSAGAIFTLVNSSIFGNNTTTRRHLSLMAMSNTPDLDCYAIFSAGELTWTAEL